MEVYLFGFKPLLSDMILVRKIKLNQGPSFKGDSALSEVSSGTALVLCMYRTVLSVYVLNCDTGTPSVRVELGVSVIRLQNWSHIESPYFGTYS